MLFSADTQAQLKPETSLAGSRESLVWQNSKFDLEGLERFQNDRHMREAIKEGVLFPLPWDDCLISDSGLDGKWHFVLQRVVEFLVDFSRTACSELSGTPVKVNSAIRHVPRQLQLIRRGNLNAVPVSGPRASPHLTGASVDIAVVGMPASFLYLARRFLLDMEDAGFIDATLETKAQYVLHVTVFKEYK